MSTPVAVDVTVGWIAVPWPCAGIQGTIDIISPSTGAPWASTIVNSAASFPWTGTTGHHRTAMDSCPESDVTDCSAGPEKVGGPDTPGA